MTHILAVDDDPEVLGTLGRFLRRESFEFKLASSGPEALEYLQSNIPDLIMLDVIMPGMDGIAVCSRIRANGQFTTVPILFLTAKGSTDDVVEGLDAGADDYIIKPFEVSELRARVQALLRRGNRNDQSDKPEKLLQVRDLRLDTDNYRAYVGEESIPLTLTEYRLLRHLMENTNQALSLTDLLQSVWDYPPNTGDPDLVRAHVRNLRKKLDGDDTQRYIRTVHSIGYMMTN
ncbi:MAG TPA: response regulator transcription factor [Phototrophicaceae bacterium]|jgi:DNA-binding response OmpR family regulator|nr:response regulator transcription factor [Phototrophicaceae bacterium]